jgi:adenosylmethionine-8-amino-7-oxononanoate aminotransferase
MVAFAPPLTTSAEEIDEIMGIFEEALDEVVRRVAPGRLSAAKA